MLIPGDTRTRHTVVHAAARFQTIAQIFTLTPGISRYLVGTMSIMLPTLFTSALALPLLVERHANGLLELRLNRPEKLNALSAELVQALTVEVQQAQASFSVAGILLTAEPGRAFCAGGDIREVAAMPHDDAQEFLTDEYQLCLSLHELSFSKPVVALADGLIFGAGAGLFMSAGVRVASGASTFSMPECVIGLVPDTGATDFLGRLPPELALYASLTGARLDAPLMAACGLLTHTGPSGATALREALVTAPSVTTPAEVVQLVEAHAVAAPAGLDERSRPSDDEEAGATPASEGTDGATSLAAGGGAYDASGRKLLDAACRVFDHGPDDEDDWCAEAAARQLESLVQRLQAEEESALAGGDEQLEGWAREAREKLGRGSPAALVLSYAARRAPLGDEPRLRRARALGLEYAAQVGLATRLPDFGEGVACALGTRRGEAPRWAHETVAEAAADPRVRALLEEMRRAAPMAASRE